MVYLPHWRRASEPQYENYKRKQNKISYKPSTGMPKAIIIIIVLYGKQFER